MAIQWTTEQQQVIQLRDRNLLVSAAAGSGKTAVLVERILSRITDPDPDKRINVDQLLIVTFTKAAAAEMRSRIEAALRVRLQAEPENTHLQKQMTLVHYAQITTIDSFCSHVVRTHFDELDQDPDFRVADEGELKLLRGDLLEALLEEQYGAATAGETMGQIQPEEFLELVEALSVGKTDEAIADRVEELYDFVCAHPFPEETLQQWADGGGEEWLTTLMTELQKEAKELIDRYDTAIELCNGPEGPGAYAPMFVQDRELARQIYRAGNYEEWQQALGNLEFVRKPVLRKQEAQSVDPDLKAYLSDLRDEQKEVMKKWVEKYVYPDREEMERQIRESEKPLRALCNLTQTFRQRFQTAKKEKHLVDFNDLEHMALEILTTREGDQLVPSQVARQLQQTYREVMIDEYQDSNLVQELLLSSVSGHWEGHPNQFMVGDVKQSIYKFRMARPELFMEKYASYSSESGPNQKIDLHQNFRSRSQVLNAANFCFEKLMMPSLGGIAYDQANALYPGAEFAPLPERETEEVYKTELLLADLEDEEGYLGEVNSREAEAKLIVKRIRELTDEKTGLLLWDKEKGEYRRAGYGDIVILLRTFTGWSETFAGVLQNAGIPAYAQQTTGYFTAMEVQIVLSYLKILDNPMQDIPLAAVMHSPIGGFSSQELALIQAAFRKQERTEGPSGLYGACLYGAEQNPKMAAFLEQLETLRRKAHYLPLHELLQQIYTETGYYELVSVMPNGGVRRANLDMLMEKAIAYEGTSYYGLFDFVRYIERLHSYNIDFGEAAPEGENGDTVRITTIHKSKGLEFPIVFVAGMGKTWNKGDTMGRLVMHPDLGIAADYMDPKLRLRTPTLKKRAIVRQLERDMLGEELRVLYVAMTRAKEKLILTGTHKSFHKKLEKAKQQPEQRKGSLPASQVAAGASYLDWLFLCLPGSAINRGLYGKELQDSYGKDTACPIEVKLVPFDQLITEEVREAVRRKEQRTSLEQWDTSQVYDENMREGMKRQLSYEYPYAREEELPVKLSVSQLKHAAMDEDLESCRLVADPEEEEVTLPRFLQKETKISGASRGTVYHKLLERLDMAQLTTWGRKGDKEAFERQLFAWQQNGILTEEEKQAVDVPQFMKFADTELVERMARAAKAGLLFREKPFVIGIPAHEMDPEITGKELVVVQGIIDVYWQEGDHIILLDYKTDRVGRKDGAEILKKRYRAQLDYYARALEQATGLSVTEKIIYSFSLGETIYL